VLLNRKGGRSRPDRAPRDLSTGCGKEPGFRFAASGLHNFFYTFFLRIFFTPFFWFSEKIVAVCSLFVLDLANRTNIIAPSSSGEGRVMTVHHDAELDAEAATMPGLKAAAYGWNVRESWR
jgi:hypothetical protein